MQARSLLQWRDRSGLRASALPAFSVRWNPSTPDPIVILLYNIHGSTLDDHCQYIQSAYRLPDEEKIRQEKEASGIPVGECPAPD